MKAITAIKERRSIRKYQKKDIPKDVIEDIVDCARFAASARNEQPWEFIAIKEKRKLKDIANSTENGKFIEGANACIAVFCKNTAKYKVEDGCAATQNMLVAAKAHGISSCWVAGYQKPYSDRISDILNVPEEYTLISLVSLGYSNEQKTVNKRSLQEVLHWESF
ncbi:MAG: nitroreductase family protein [Clostridia bacterium]|nr:nitroreductase family protein [Clostridia bacterium]